MSTQEERISNVEFNYRKLAHETGMMYGIVRNDLDILKDQGYRIHSRVDDVNQYLEGRFEAADKRFDSIDKQLAAADKRFEAADTRFDSVDTRLDRMETLLTQVLARLPDNQQ